MKIVALAASNRSQSINKKLAAYTASLADNASVEVLDINDFEMPIFSEDREKVIGHHELAIAFFNKLKDSDAIVISYAEHNGSYSAAYKNLFDWTSRYNRELFQNKPMILLATSPGPGGAANVLKAATDSAPFFAGNVVASISVPSFYDNYNAETGEITQAGIKATLQNAANKLSA